jgi:hypothetical protein
MVIEDYLEGADIRDIRAMPTYRRKWITQAEEVLVPSWSFEFRIIARFRTDRVTSLNEIINLWDTGGSFNTRLRPCLFDSIEGLSRRSRCDTDDMDVITNAMAMGRDIKKNAEMRHSCAGLTFTHFTIIRGFLSYVDDRDLMQFQNHFLT